MIFAIIVDQSGSRKRETKRAQPAAAIGLGDENGEKTGIGQRLDELARISPLPVQLTPIVSGKLAAELGDGVADVLMVC